MLAKDVMILNVDDMKKILDCFKLSFKGKKREVDLKFKTPNDKNQKEEIISLVLKLKEEAKTYNNDLEEIQKLSVLA